MVPSTRFLSRRKGFNPAFLTIWMQMRRLLFHDKIRITPKPLKSPYRTTTPVNTHTEQEATGLAFNGYPKLLLLAISIRQLPVCFYYQLGCNAFVQKSSNIRKLKNYFNTPEPLSWRFYRWHFLVILRIADGLCKGAWIISATYSVMGHKTKRKEIALSDWCVCTCNASPPWFALPLHLVHRHPSQCHRRIVADKLVA